MGNFFSIPCAVGISILSDKILFILFKDSNAAKILSILSFSIVLVSTAQVTTAVFQGIGKSMIPVKSLLIGAVVKAVSNYILIGIPSLNILGAAISTILCYLVVSILNIIEINKRLKVKSSFSNIIH